jgi:hypothetical protein
MKFSVILWGIPQAMRTVAAIYPEFAERLKEKNLTAQFRVADKELGRWIKLENGKISSSSGIHENPDMTLIFKNEAIGASFLTPPFDQLERIDAAKNFKIGVEGPDDLAVWFMALLAVWKPLPGRPAPTWAMV